MLMKCVALHNAPLLHQHSCRRMDSGALNARDQLPPAGFYAKILVCTHWPKAYFPPILATQCLVEGVPAGVSDDNSLYRCHAGLQPTVCSPSYSRPTFALSRGICTRSDLSSPQAVLPAMQPSECMAGCRICWG